MILLLFMMMMLLCMMMVMFVDGISVLLVIISPVKHFREEVMDDLSALREHHEGPDRLWRNYSAQNREVFFLDLLFAGFDCNMGEEAAHTARISTL